MPPNPPRPPSPWAQNVSAFFNNSGAFLVATKFRQVDNYGVTMVMNASTMLAAYTKFPPLLATSAGKGLIFGQLYSVASAGGAIITSAALGISALNSTSVNIWATGVM